ncbi:MAG: carboxypeptidase-like regulatory domain-containing protein [Planctomycetota bacterium]
MKRRIGLGLGAVVAVLVGAALVLLGGGAREDSPADAPAPAAERAQPRGAAEVAGVTDPGADARRASDAAPAPDAPDMPGEEEQAAELVVLGRCLTENGTPVVGAAVELRIDDLRGSRPSDLRKASTGADGRFRLAIPRTPHSALRLKCSAEGRSTESLALGELPDANELDAGDVVLERGCSFFGSVSTPDGAALEGAQIVARRVVAADRQLPAESTRSHGIPSRADGSYETWSLPADVWELEVRGRGLRSTPPRRVDASAGGAKRIDWTVEPLAPIAGVVLLAEGGPAAGARVTARESLDGAEATFSAVTGEDGSFELQSRPGWEGGDEVLVALTEGGDFEAEPALAAFGHRDVVLLARRKPRLVLRVVDGAGAPVADYAYRISPSEDVGGSWGESRSPDGIVELTALPEAAWLFVIPREEHRARGPVALPRSGQLDVEVGDVHPLTATVRTADGAPVPGATIDVVSLRTGASRGGAQLTLDARRASIFSASDTWLWSSADTDGGGEATVELPDLSSADLALRLTGPSGEQLHVPVARDQRSAELILPAGGAVALSLTGDWPPGLRLHLVHTTVGALEPVPRAGLLATGGETVTLSGLAPGEWELRANHANRSYPLRVVAFAGGESQALTLDADDVLAPAREIQVLRADGTAFAGEVRLALETRTGPLELLRVQVDGGRLPLPVLPRGAYRVALGQGAETALDEAAWAAPVWHLP